MEKLHISSVNSIRKMPELFTTLLGKSFMKIIKSRGPITDPWGIPLITSCQSEYELFTLTEFCEPAMLQPNPGCFPLFHSSGLCTIDVYTTVIVSLKVGDVALCQMLS